MEKHKAKTLKILIAYYGLLQSLHLIVLIRAGSLLLQGEQFPFPILPPPEGWHAQTLPFMFGLAGMDVLGIILGVIFSFRFIIKNKFNPLLGLISLTIFISGAVIFGAGTFPAGAWTAHPYAYWIMVLLFSPSVILFIKLITSLRTQNI